MDRSTAVAEMRGVVARFGRDHVADEGRWCVALSGGSDSLALTAAAAAKHVADSLPKGFSQVSVNVPQKLGGGTVQAAMIGES